MRYSIRLAKLADGPSVTRLYNKVTLDLLEKGQRQWAYPWSSRTLAKEIGRGHVHLLNNDQQVIGAFFLQTITELPPLLLTKKCLYLSKMAVLPNQQGQAYGQLILDYCQKLSATHQLSVYLECHSNNHELREYIKQSSCELLIISDERAVYQLIN